MVEVIFKSYYKQKFIPHLLTDFASYSFSPTEENKNISPRQRRNVINNYFQRSILSIS